MGIDALLSGRPIVRITLFLVDEADLASSQTSSSSATSEDLEVFHDYVIVERVQLVKLLSRCKECGSPLRDDEITMVRTLSVLTKSTYLPPSYYFQVGCVLKNTGFCEKHGQQNWNSSGRVKGIVKLNLDLAVATYTSGMNVASLLRVSRCMGLALPHRSTFERLQQVKYTKFGRE